MLRGPSCPSALRSARRNSLTLWQWMQPLWLFAAAKSSARTEIPRELDGRRRGLVRLERAVHRVAESLHREARIGARGVAAAVAAVDRLVRIEEEGIPGQVEVELEAAQVDAGDLHQPDADESVGDVGDILVETNNLLVEIGAVASGLAAEDEEDRLAGSLCLGLAAA